MDQKKAGILLSYALIVLNIIVNIVYVPLLLYYMGQNEYGLYRLMGSFIIYLTFMDFGLSVTITRFYTKYKVLNDIIKMENIIALSLILYSIIGVLIVIVGAAGFLFLDDIFSNALTITEIYNAKRIYVLLLLNILFAFGGQSFTSIIIAHERFVFLKSLTLGQVLLQPFFIIAVMTVSPYAFNLVLVQFLFNVIAILLKMGYCLKNLKIKIKLHFFDQKMMKEMFVFSGSVFAIVIVDQIFFQANQVVLGIVAGTAVVAIYGIAAQIYMNYIALGTVISGMFLPHVTKMIANGDSTEKFTHLFIKFGRIQFLLLAMILSSYILFGQEFILLWAGAAFLESYWIVLMMMIPLTIDLIQHIGLSILQAKGIYGFRARVFVCAGLANIILGIPFAIWYGGIGCAFITGLMIFLSNGPIMNYYYCRVVKIDIIEFWSQICKILIVVIACSPVGIMLNCFDFPLGILGFMIKLSFYIFIYLVAIWNFAMNTYEKTMLINLVKKMKHAKAFIYSR